MAYRRRRDLEMVAMLLCDHDSSSDGSSSEDDLEVLLLHLNEKPKHILGPRLNLEDLTNLECEQLFRFSKDDMVYLSTALCLPDKYVCKQGTTTTGMEALMVMLRRLAYPNRLCDLVPLFGRTEWELSLIFATIIDDVYDRFGHLLRDLDLVWLDTESFAAAVHAKGAPLQQCFGFIDGTVRPIARPTVNQRIMYSGHKRVHCITFQSVVTPNGLVAHMFGPMEGRRHDAFMLSVSGLPNKLRPLSQPNGQPYVLYGDPAYGLSRNILSPFRGAHLTPLEQDFNQKMSAVRVSVEWGFGKILQQFAYLDFKKNLKVLLQPVGKYYLVGTACMDRKHQLSSTCHHPV